MSLNYRQRCQLHRTEARLLRSDPRLAAMLGAFGRLSSGQGMPAWEQIATRRDRVRQAAALIVQAIAVLAAAIGLLFSAVLALFTAVVMGRRARPPRPTHQQTRPSPP
jgi:hypothetical protein